MGVNFNRLNVVYWRAMNCLMISCIDSVGEAGIYQYNASTLQRPAGHCPEVFVTRFSLKALWQARHSLLTPPDILSGFSGSIRYDLYEVEIHRLCTSIIFNHFCLARLLRSK